MNDPSKLRISLALGSTVAGIAQEAGSARSVVVAALRRHEITVPPRKMPVVERIRALTDRAERARAAELFDAVVRAYLAAARRIRLEARRQAEGSR